MAVSISEQPFEPWELGADLERQLVEQHGKVGACVSFIGTMRDFNDGDEVSTMELEYYPGMTERVLEQILSETSQQFGVTQAHIHHRVGPINPGDAIVVVVVWSAHRREAFEACRQLIEFLKQRAPFWKRERLPNGNARWVTHNTVG